MNYKKVDLHPATIKHLNAGHFWVTEDSFTKKFPKEDLLLIGIDSKTKKEVGLFIQDKRHKHVKARLFSKNIKIDLNNEILDRIENAIKKRSELNLINERENLLLINGEADQLPGLLVLLLKDRIMIQYYALYWTEFEKIIIPKIEESFQKYFPRISLVDIFIQERNFEQNKSIRSLKKSSALDYVLSEFGVNYNIKINAYYDYGIYTDMSAIRKQLQPFIKNKSKFLNLFCYTGAYSLFALNNEVNHVTSVDLSKKYLDWLDDNIKINPNMDASNHRSLNIAVDKALDQFIASDERFDFIFSDPPSSSSDGEKRDNAFNAYEKQLPKLLKLLERNGCLVVFLNTHQISWNKFEDKLKEIISKTEFKDQVIVGKRFKLAEDYLPSKGFYEGDYLKGFLIEYKNKKG